MERDPAPSAGLVRSSYTPAVASPADDLEARLRASGAVESLAAEEAIAETLTQLGWGASHGMYYTDPATGKSRELDVVAAQLWHRDEHGIDLSCTLRLLVESKSARDFHLVFASTPQFHSRNTLAEWWIGEREVRDRTIAALLAADVNRDEIAKLRERYDTLSSDISKLDPVPIPVAAVGTTYKETNIGGEKDLDNSVLWRAILTLSSATEALRRRQMQTRLEDLLRTVTEARVLRDSPLADLRSAIEMLLGHREYYHRIVVIDSPLWMLAGGKLTRVPWCRFEQRNEWDHANDWFDIVARAEFESYAQALTAHFETARQQERAELLDV